MSESPAQYGDIADRLGHPGAARAVAQRMLAMNGVRSDPGRRASTGVADQAGRRHDEGAAAAPTLSTTATATFDTRSVDLDASTMCTVDAAGSEVCAER